MLTWDVASQVVFGSKVVAQQMGTVACVIALSVHLHKVCIQEWRVVMTIKCYLKAKSSVARVMLSRQSDFLACITGPSSSRHAFGLEWRSGGITSVALYCVQCHSWHGISNLKLTKRLSHHIVATHYWLQNRLSNLAGCPANCFACRWNLLPVPFAAGLYPAVASHTSLHAVVHPCLISAVQLFVDPQRGYCTCCMLP